MKTTLFSRGMALMDSFCEANALLTPEVAKHASADWPFTSCAYYRPTKIEICLAKCASIGVAGPAWSYPGYAVDRTPYGVLQHELGHHVDVVMGGATRGYTSLFSREVRRAAEEEKLTSYCPNDGEWFAEMFRLFVTNPNLLREMRPRTAGILDSYFTPVVTAPWREVLKGAPARTLTTAERRARAKT